MLNSAELLDAYRNQAGLEAFEAVEIVVEFLSSYGMADRSGLTTDAGTIPAVVRSVLMETVCRGDEKPASYSSSAPKPEH